MTSTHSSSSASSGEKKGLLELQETHPLPRYSPKDAFEQNDLEGSRLIHDRRCQEDHVESHDEAGQYIKTVVFGGLDGIITSFSLVSAALGGGFTWQVVLVMGIANLLGDAFGMGAGEYLSSKSHRDFILSERDRERWEYRNYKEGEVKEMVNIFHKRGMSRSDAELVINKMAEYEDFFIDVMITEELGLTLPEEDDTAFLKDAFIMFASFAIFGFIPLLPYCLGPLNILSEETISYLAIAATGVALFTLGSLKSISTRTAWYKEGMESLVVGSLCALVAYGIGIAVGDFILLK